MAKFSVSTALNLYEEDIEIRNELKALDAPELDPHWEDWYKYGLSIEPPIEDKIAVDQASSRFTKNDVSDVSTFNILGKDSTRSVRRRFTARTKKHFFANAKIAKNNYSKRADDAIYYTSVIDGEKVCNHSYACVRAERLIKNVSKLQKAKTATDTTEFQKKEEPEKTAKLQKSQKPAYFRKPKTTFSMTK